MIQDIAPHRFYNEFTPKQPEGDDPVFCFNGRTVLVKKNGESFSFPQAKEFADKEELVYLFHIDEQNFFLKNGSVQEPFGNYAYEPTTIFRTWDEKFLSFAGMTAYHLYVWYRDNSFCGRCGTKTTYSETERALVCPDCGNIIYPKICPAVIVGVTNGDEIVVTRYAGRPYRGYALIAGFCEIGETVEETVKREVMEEIGLSVTNIRYYKSQPWGFESDLLLGYYCDVEGSTEIHRDESELAIAEWKSRDELPPQKVDLSLTGEIMEMFRIKKDRQY